ncbi:MAG: VWA domain-containing protein, partial [Gammaproteobacteria bacterium]
RRLAARPARRLAPGRRRGRVDLRRSLRRNVRHGLDLVDLARVQAKTRKTRLVMLCDVSGSMDAFNPFLLQLMLGLQQALPSSRTLVFSTKTTEITALLRRRSVEETLNAVADEVRHWSGGTDIGAALAGLNRGLLREGSARSTVLIVISDGYDNGPVERIRAELEAAKRRLRTLVWINPMFGATTFTVRAAGMKAALPYVDHFLPAFNAAALRRLVAELGALR